MNALENPGAFPFSKLRNYDCFPYIKEKLLIRLSNVLSNYDFVSP